MLHTAYFSSMMLQLPDRFHRFIQPNLLTFCSIIVKMTHFWSPEIISREKCHFSAFKEDVAIDIQSFLFFLERE